jgi:hypothetical protein
MAMVHVVFSSSDATTLAVLKVKAHLLYAEDRRGTK